MSSFQRAWADGKTVRFHALRTEKTPKNLIARVVVFPRLDDQMPMGGVILVWRQGNMGACQEFDALFDKMYPDLSMAAGTKTLEESLKDNGDKHHLDKYFETSQKRDIKRKALLQDLGRNHLFRLPVSKLTVAMCEE